MKKIEKLKPYIVEFYENGAMKPKTYPSNCAVWRENWRPVIVITYDECTFFANDGDCRVWTWKEDTFLWSKRQK